MNMEGEKVIEINDKDGKRRYHYDGQLYHFTHGTSITTMNYRCVQYKGPFSCPVKLRSFPDGTVKLSHKEHATHYPPNQPLERAAMHQAMKEKACKTFDNPSKIIRTVSRDHSTVAGQVSVSASTSYIKRKRRKIGRAKEPATLEELGKILEENPEMKELTRDNFQGVVHPTDGGAGCALIFVSNKMLAELNVTEIIEVDGSMKAVPDVPEATQMWIVNIRKNNQAVAAVFAYCRGARAELYEAILLRLMKLAPGLHNVKLIISDFEKAPLKAVGRVLPGKRKQGCWFHFTKATSDHWNGSQVPYTPREAKYLARSLALLPAELINMGIEEIEKRSIRYYEIFPMLPKWIRYLRKEWGRKPHIVSVYGSLIRTNNDSEAYNRHYTDRIGGRKVRIYPLLENLQKLIEDELIKVQRLNEGIPIGKKQKPMKMSDRDKRIRNAEIKLLSGPITGDKIDQFLLECLPEDLVEEILEERSLTPHTLLLAKMAAEQKRATVSVRGQRKNEEYGVKRKRRHRRTQGASILRAVRNLKRHGESSEKPENGVKVTVTDKNLDSDADSLDGLHDLEVLEYLLQCHGNDSCPYVIKTTVEFDANSIDNYQA